MTDFATADFFRDENLLREPYPYFDFLRGQCPVYRESQHGVVMVTGYEEAAAIQADVARFSSCNSTTGPFAPFPVPLAGDDVSAIIDQHRYELPFSDMILSLDPPEHTARRDKVTEMFSQPVEGGGVGSTPGEAMANHPLARLYGEFCRYVEERRREPREDVLSGLATATFPDGSLPDVLDVVRVATIIFAAGHESSTRFLTSALMILAEDRDLQARLRAEPGLIANFVEEVLRTASVVKGDFRLARVSTEVAGVEIPAGTMEPAL